MFLFQQKQFLTQIRGSFVLETEVSATLLQDRTEEKSPLTQKSLELSTHLGSSPLCACSRAFAYSDSKPILDLDFQKVKTRFCGLVKSGGVFVCVT